jgi:hypothetical protein
VRAVAGRSAAAWPVAEAATARTVIALTLGKRSGGSLASLTKGALRAFAAWRALLPWTLVAAILSAGPLIAWTALRPVTKAAG